MVTHIFFAASGFPVGAVVGVVVGVVVGGIAAVIVFVVAVFCYLKNEKSGTYECNRLVRRVLYCKK